MHHLLDWYTKLWRVETPDLEAQVCEIERKLGLELPPLLHQFYVGTSLRDGQMLHVQELGALRVSAGALVFGREQQGFEFWAIPLEALVEPDPPLVYGDLKHWADDGSTLDGFLRYFAVTNRPFLPPHCDASDFDARRLVGAWQRHSIAWRSIQHDDLWTNGEAVLDENAFALGARDEDALRRAAESLDVDLD